MLKGRYNAPYTQFQNIISISLILAFLLLFVALCSYFFCVVGCVEQFCEASCTKDNFFLVEVLVAYLAIPLLPRLWRIFPFSLHVTDSRLADFRVCNLPMAFPFQNGERKN
jgi:hypothetical protein